MGGVIGARLAPTHHLHWGRSTNFTITNTMITRTSTSTSTSPRTPARARSRTAVCWMGRAAL